MREVHGNTVKRESEEAWSSFVARAAAETRAYLQLFNPWDIVEPGLVYFNVVWVNDADFSAREQGMNGSAHRQRPNTNKRLFDGRLEKRLAMSVPVYLASFGEPRVRERTVTENVSPHGASVISQRPWRSGEEALIAPP